MTRALVPVTLGLTLLFGAPAFAGDLHPGVDALGDTHELSTRPDASRTLPLLVGRDLRGRPFDLAVAAEEGPVLLVVWFADCPTCPRALQRLIDWAAEQPDVPMVVGVNGDSVQERAWLRPFLQRSELNLTVLADPAGDLRQGLGIEESPAVVLLGPAGSGEVVRHQPDRERLSMDRLARSWIQAVEAQPSVLAAR